MGLNSGDFADGVTLLVLGVNVGALSLRNLQSCVLSVFRSFAPDLLVIRYSAAIYPQVRSTKSYSLAEH